MLFKIRIKLLAKHENLVLTGLDALDQTRRLGLPEATMLNFTQAYDNTLEVSEEFALQYFSRTEYDVTRLVDLSVLKPGDIVLSSVGNPTFNLSGMTNERIQELWHAGEEIE